MKPFIRHRGVAATLDRANVDTDQIIPKQFLKRVERTGYGKFMFFDWRYLDDGTPNLDFELNRPEYKGASVLLVRDNFGCGSSREHAAWALDDYGIRALIGPSFADIFYNNCFENGILPVVLDGEMVDQLFDRVRANPGLELTVDLEAKTITDDDGLHLTFDIDDFRRERLLRGLDRIGLTLEHVDRIADYEQRRRREAPWIWPRVDSEESRQATG